MAWIVQDVKMEVVGFGRTQSHMPNHIRNSQEGGEHYIQLGFKHIF